MKKKREEEKEEEEEEEEGKKEDVPRATDRQIGRLLGLTGSGLEVAKFFSNFSPPFSHPTTNRSSTGRTDYTGPHVYPTNLKVCNSWIQMFPCPRTVITGRTIEEIDIKLGSKLLEFEEVSRNDERSYTIFVRTRSIINF